MASQQDSTSTPTIASKETEAGPAAPAVRFASINQEIQTAQGSQSDIPASPGSEEATLKELSQTLQGTQLAGRRMSHFAFEPVSLPASRVPSHEDSSREPSRYNTHTSSGHQSPRVSAMHSPPITPAATRSRDVDGQAKGAPLQQTEAVGSNTAITPQVSPPVASLSSTNLDESRAASEGGSTRPSSLKTDDSNAAPSKHKGFSIGPGSQTTSVPPSRDASPSRGAAYSRPFTPAGDVNDPYAANKRPPQSRNIDAVEQRFKFAALGSKHRSSPSTSSLNLPRSSRSSMDVNPGASKRHSHLFGSKDHPEHLNDDSSSAVGSKHGSMSELKRFLKIGGGKTKRTASPTPSTKRSTVAKVASAKVSDHHKSSPQQLPFGEDHGLTSKYGKFGKVLGAGAGGSVRLMKRSSDGTTFAVKEFRARHSYESEKEYSKKVTAEFCVGSSLHHGNIIETLDIVHERGKWYEVMEYAPFDLFAIVMTGKMSREEVACCFLQILAGVTYLHSMGLAHRDLKLDNVVVNEHGIMKIIDFGSASVFKYPFESGIVFASGIVGSDPYLAPEVYDERKYDPQPADIWSLAIIFCCMSLRRFPWKMPRMTDNSYKLFASAPTPGTDLRKMSEAPSTKSGTDEATTDGGSKPGSRANSRPTTPKNETAPPTEIKKPEVIKGPWRLLRLLPRESRHIIGRMLELDPKKRATMDDVLADPWISGTIICRQEDRGKVERAEGHTHTLEPPASAPAPTK